MNAIPIKVVGNVNLYETPGVGGWVSLPSSNFVAESYFHAYAQIPAGTSFALAVGMIQAAIPVGEPFAPLAGLGYVVTRLVITDIYEASGMYDVVIYGLRTTPGAVLNGGVGAETCQVRHSPQQYPTIVHRNWASQLGTGYSAVKIDVDTQITFIPALIPPGPSFDRINYLMGELQQTVTLKTVLLHCRRYPEDFSAIYASCTGDSRASMDKIRPLFDLQVTGADNYVSGGLTVESVNLAPTASPYSNFVGEFSDKAAAALCGVSSSLMSAKVIAEFASTKKAHFYLAHDEVTLNEHLFRHSVAYTSMVLPPKKLYIVNP